MSVSPLRTIWLSSHKNNFRPVPLICFISHIKVNEKTKRKRKVHQRKPPGTQGALRGHTPPLTPRYPPSLSRPSSPTSLPHPSPKLQWTFLSSLTFPTNFHYSPLSSSPLYPSSPGSPRSDPSGIQRVFRVTSTSRYNRVVLYFSYLYLLVYRPSPRSLRPFLFQSDP